MKRAEIGGLRCGMINPWGDFPPGISEVCWLDEGHDPDLLEHEVIHEGPLGDRWTSRGTVEKRKPEGLAEAAQRVRLAWFLLWLQIVRDLKKGLEKAIDKAGRKP